MKLNYSIVINLLCWVFLSMTPNLLAAPVPAIVEENSTERLSYPPAPEPIRIQFQYAFSEPKDLKIKESFWKAIIGKREHRRLQQPTAVCKGTNGAIYVADGSGAVCAFVPNSSFRSWNGSKTNPLHHPTALAFDKKKARLFVLDGGQNRIFVLKPSLDVIHEWSTNLRRTSGLALDSERNELYLADVENHRIVVYSTDGALIRQWGSAGDSTAGLHSPTHLLFSNDALYVTDALNFCVKRYSRDGTLFACIGKAGSSSGTFARPKGIALDSEQHLYVVDALFGNVQLFNTQGQVLVAFGSNGTELGQFSLPNGIWIDENDTIYIADTYNSRVQVYQYFKEPKPRIKRD